MVLSVHIGTDQVLPYLPKYNAHPCIMCIPILKPVFRKKSVSTSFLKKTNFLEKFSRNAKSSSTCTKISYRSWCKSFNVLSVQWYIKFYDVFFIFFCCFAAARSNEIHLHNTCNIFMNKSWKYQRKCNRFSIAIANKLHDWCHDGRGLKWCTKLDKLFVLIYFYWLHKIGSCSTLHFLCCYANDLKWKQKVPCKMRISILEAKFVRKKCPLYTGKYGINSWTRSSWTSNMIAAL